MRRFAPIVLVVFVIGGCTGGGARPTPSGPAGRSAGSSGPTPFVFDVVAGMGGPAGTVPEYAVLDDTSYLDGMRLAERAINAGGGIRGRPLVLRFFDDRGDSARATAVMQRLIPARPAAILYAGWGSALLPLRPALDQAGIPVVLLQGDLYSSQHLFPEVFQATIPWAWQVRFIARYLVLDRQAHRIVFVGAGPEAATAKVATGQALAYWGGRLADSVVYPASATVPSAPPAKVATADAVVVFGDSYASNVIAGGIQQLQHPPRVSAGEALLQSSARLPFPRPGTTACSMYTWSGWAQPIPRVASFIKAYGAAFGGSQPANLAQEGYDAVRALGYGLAKDGGRGASALRSSLETMGEVTFSGFPILLGPDDHVFPPRDELGLFAVPGPTERVDPWLGHGGEVWRPVMRTFTTDGRRDSILDRDRPVFFPFWGKGQPGPYYWQSRYGIVTRLSDPLH